MFQSFCEMLSEFGLFQFVVIELVKDASVCVGLRVIMCARITMFHVHLTKVMI